MGDFNHVLLIFIVLFVKSVYWVHSDCSLSLNKDLGTPEPVYIDNQNGELLAVNLNGTINVVRSETIGVACVGDKRFVVLDNKTQDFSFVEAECVANSTFRVGQWEGEFKNIKCNLPPWVTAENTGQFCYGNNQIYRVGYKINDKFYTVYEICFDKGLLTTLYTHHIVDPSVQYSQRGKRVSFIENNFLFGKNRMAKLYRRANQRKIINAALGEDKDQLYLTNKQYLTRGHLAPRADFPFRGGQRASHLYANVAPQWRRGNAGDWAALEEGFRRRIKTHSDKVSVYTGTYGVMTLPDSEGRQVPLYLGSDKNNNPVVPVPMYYYKVLHDPVLKSAVAFVSINSSFYNTTRLQSLTFCDDICKNGDLDWLTWRANDGTFSYCCEFSDFNKTVDHLAGLEVQKMFF